MRRLPVCSDQGSQGSGSPARTSGSGKDWCHGKRRRDIITGPRLSELIAEAVQEAEPRIIVTVVAPEESKAREAIALRSHELFVREGVKTIQ